MPRPDREYCFSPPMKPIQVLIGLSLFALLAGRVLPTETKGDKYWFVSGRIESFPASGLVMVRTQTQQRRIIRYERCSPIGVHRNPLFSTDSLASQSGA